MASVHKVGTRRTVVHRRQDLFWLLTSALVARRVLKRRGFLIHPGVTAGVRVAWRSPVRDVRSGDRVGLLEVTVDKRSIRVRFETQSGEESDWDCAFSNRRRPSSRRLFSCVAAHADRIRHSHAYREIASDVMES